MPGPSTIRCRAQLGTLLLAGAPPARNECRKLRELHVRVRGGSSPGGLWPGKVRTARSHQGNVRPRQCLLSQREHQAGAPATPKLRKADSEDASCTVAPSSCLATT